MVTYVHDEPRIATYDAGTLAGHTRAGHALYPPAMPSSITTR